MAEDTVRQLDAIFRPKSVALIGASNNPAKWGGMVLNRMLSSDFRGRIYPVNPKETEIFGLKAYSNVVEIPDAVDLALIVVANRLVPGVLRECASKGIKTAVIITSGFGETGKQGQKLEAELAGIARQECCIGADVRGAYRFWRSA